MVLPAVRVGLPPDINPRLICLQSTQNSLNVQITRTPKDARAIISKDLRLLHVTRRAGAKYPKASGPCGTGYGKGRGQQQGPLERLDDT